MVVVVAEVDSDRSRHDLLVAYFRWASTSMGAPEGSATVVRGALINDIACLRLGVLAGAPGEALPRPGAAPRLREDGRAACWSLLVAIDVDRARVETREQGFGQGAEVMVDIRAGRLAKALRACGQGRVSLLRPPLYSPDAFERLPLVLRCLPATELVCGWLDGSVAAWSRATFDVYLGGSTPSPLRLHALGDATVAPWGEALVARAAGPSDTPVPIQPRIQRRSLWRIYRRPTDSAAAAREASGALVDGSRPAFEAQDLELAWVTPLGDLPSGHRHELIGTAQVDAASIHRVEHAFAAADAIAANLEYQVVQPEVHRFPMPLRSRQSGPVPSLEERR